MVKLYTVIFAQPVLAAIYILLSVIASWRGNRTFLGFWGNMILSLIITPFILMALIAIFSDRRSLEKRG